jgi:hypothetical protein
MTFIADEFHAKKLLSLLTLCVPHPGSTVSRAKAIQRWSEDAEAIESKFDLALSGALRLGWLREDGAELVVTLDGFMSQEENPKL